MNKKRIYVAIKKIFYVIIIPIVIAQLFVFSASQLNYTFTQIPALSIFRSPAFNSVISQLRNIDINPPIQGVNNRLIETRIMREQMKKAYQFSYTLKLLEPYIELSLHKKLTRFLGESADTLTTSTVEVPGAIMYWSLIEGVKNYVKDNRLDEQDSFKKAQKTSYQIITQVDHELKIAFQNHQLTRKEKKILFKNLRYELRLIKDSAQKTVRYLVFPTYRDKNVLSIVDDPRVNEEMANDFNKIANRRIYNIGMKNFKLAQFLQKTSVIVHCLNLMGIISFFLFYFFYLTDQLKTNFSKKYVVILSFVLLLILSRIILYTFIDTFFFSISTRYLFLAAPLISGFSLLNIYVILELIFQKKKENDLARI